MKKLITLALVLLIAFSVSAQKSIDKKLKELDAYYEQALIDWNVPGMAVAIVKDGKIIFSKGYGIINVNTGEKVDGNSLFAIASNSKAFTSAAIAMLIDEGKMSWDDKVRDYLPWFELYDPYVSENFTIEDLLTHRSGLKTFSGDLLWYGSDLSRKEVVENARYLEPTFGFRNGWGYSNIMYITAGLVIEEVSGMNWDDYIRERILVPLHMDRTVSSTNMLEGMENVSSPHNDVEDDVITIDWLNWDNIAPAGGLISSANDMSKWLIFQMNRGITPDGDTLISSRRFSEMWTLYNPQGISSWSEQNWPSTHFKGYGLGWALFDYHGKKIIGHGGGYDGFISCEASLIPQQLFSFCTREWTDTTLVHIQESLYKLEVDVHPNPVDSGTLTVDIYNSENESYSIKIYDSSGKVVFRREYTATLGGDKQSFIINIPGIRAGMYLLQILSEGFHAKEKIIVK